MKNLIPDTCVECGSAVFIDKTAKWNQCEKCKTMYESLFNKQGNELVYDENSGHFYDPQTDQEYFVEVVEVDPENSDAGDDDLGHEYLEYDPDEELFIDQETGIGYDLDMEHEDIEDEYDPEEKTAYTMNLRRRYRSRGISRSHHKQYYRQHKTVVRRKQKMYKLKNKRFLKIRTRRIHHHYFGH